MDASFAQAFDLARLNRAFLDDPYPTYRALREHDPVRRLADGSYFLTRYDDLVAIYRDSRTWSSDKTVQFKPAFGDSPLYEHHTTSLVFNDPPIHTRVRKLLAPAFTPRALNALRPRIEALVDRLLDEAARRGTIDLIEDFAAAIPVQLIGDMLGIPQAERGPLRDWSLAILGALEPVLSPAQRHQGIAAVTEFKDYLRDLVARRQREGSHDKAEILSILIAGSEIAVPSPVIPGRAEGANPESRATRAEPAALDSGSGASAPSRNDGGSDSGDRLTELELLHNCIFLLNAGHETTTNLIGNSVDLLIRHPDAMAELAARPELIETAVEEFLRMESSNQLGNRRAATDTRIGDVAVPSGSYVHLCIGAANRDPTQFPDPDRLDLARAPNRHLAFGFGIHTCAGNSLARMEAQVAIGKLVARFATVERAGDFRRGGRARFRGFLRYPVAVRGERH